MRQVPRICAVILCALFSFPNFSYASCTASFSQQVLKNGLKHTYGTIDVLNVHGSYCDMGRQVGFLEAPKLKQFYQQFHQLMQSQHPKDLNQVQQFAQRLYANYPQRFKNFLLGMSQTSGLTLEQHIFLNAFEHTLYYKNPTHQPGCSAVAVWGKHTLDEKLIVGRNYDYFEQHPEFKRMLSITVFHPASGENATAMITFLGTLNATTNINEQGLYLELNNGYPSAKIIKHNIKRYTNRMDTTIDLLSMMLDSSTLEDLNTQIHSLKSNASYIINVADSKQAYSYEWTDDNVIKANTNTFNKGVLVSTNHFVDPAWNISKQDDLWDTLQRYNNLQSLTRTYQQPFTVETMKKVLEQQFLSNQVSHQGATTSKTVYQVIVTPQTKTCWIRLPKFADSWQQINLQHYFSS